MILFRTVHGSHLYNLNHENSDLDIYEVVSDKWSKKAINSRQTISNGVDKTVVSLSTFLQMANRGVPQALEAMYSTKADIDMISDLRRSFVANQYAMEREYARVIRNMGQNSKQRKHAIRLSMNLEDHWIHGRFNPTLSDDQVQLLTRLQADGRLY